MFLPSHFSHRTGDHRHHSPPPPLTTTISMLSPSTLHAAITTFTLAADRRQKHRPGRLQSPSSLLLRSYRELSMLGYTLKPPEIPPDLGGLEQKATGKLVLGSEFYGGIEIGSEG